MEVEKFEDLTKSSTSSFLYIFMNQTSSYDPRSPYYVMIDHVDIDSSLSWSITYICKYFQKLLSFKIISLIFRVIAIDNIFRDNNSMYSNVLNKLQI